MICSQVEEVGVWNGGWRVSALTLACCWGLWPQPSGWPGSRALSHVCHTPAPQLYCNPQPLLCCMRDIRDSPRSCWETSICTNWGEKTGHVSSDIPWRQAELAKVWVVSAWCRGLSSHENTLAPPKNNPHCWWGSLGMLACDLSPASCAFQDCEAPVWDINKLLCFLSAPSSIYVRVFFLILTNYSGIFLGLSSFHCFVPFWDIKMLISIAFLSWHVWAWRFLWASCQPHCQRQKPLGKEGGLQGEKPLSKLVVLFFPSPSHGSWFLGAVCAACGLLTSTGQ